MQPRKQTPVCASARSIGPIAPARRLMIVSAFMGVLFQIFFGSPVSVTTVALPTRL